MFIGHQENLKALQARDKALAQKDQEAEEDLKAAVVERHGNPAEELLKQKKLVEFEREKQ